MSAAKDRTARAPSDSTDRSGATDHPEPDDRPGVGIHHVTVVPGNSRKNPRASGREE